MRVSSLASATELSLRIKPVYIKILVMVMCLQVWGVCLSSYMRVWDVPELVRTSERGHVIHILITYCSEVLSSSQVVFQPTSRLGTGQVDIPHTHATGHVDMWTSHTRIQLQRTAP